MSALFIVFEGPDGAGTTRHTALLAKKLREEGKEVIITAEPTQGTHGQRIREMLHSGNAGSEELQKLFIADRAEHLEKLVQPSLLLGNIVISDRFVPSTLVYGEAQGIPLRLLQNMNKNFIQPDLLFVLLPPFEVAWERVERRDVRDSFEQVAFQRKVHEGYRRYAKEHPEAIVIDTSGTKEESAERIWETVEKKLKN
jgi:dTMP kinase